MATPEGSSCLVPGIAPTPGSGLVAAHRLALEGSRLKSLLLPDKIIGTIQAARRPSTTRIYQSTWAAYRTFCLSNQLDPLHDPLVPILMFLQAGLDKGLAPNTIRRHVAALATVVHIEGVRSLSQHPCVRDFLRGAANLCPPPVRRFPTWDLSLVLRALTGPPFEPLEEVSLRFLSLKIIFLVAVTSARRVSELAALSVRQDLCVFHPDRVVLRTDPTFLPKVNTNFHRAQEIVLPDFFPEASQPVECQWQKLDVRRTLQCYLDRTHAFRKTDSLFVSFAAGSLGRKASARSISRWVRDCIIEAYKAVSIPPPQGITAHSTRSAATSAAWASQASAEDICRAATWSSTDTFIKHYKLDLFASEEASFGRRVLRQVCAAPAPLATASPALVP